MYVLSAKLLNYFDKILPYTKKVVPLHPLFGVTDDGKKCCPVMLRENDKQI